MRDAYFIILVPLVVIGALAYWGIGNSLRRRRFARLATLSAGEFVFTFDSNRWYQFALQELRDHGIIEEQAMSEDAIADGTTVHWATASEAGLAIHHGWTAKPDVAFAWSEITDIGTETFRANTRYAATGVTVNLHVVGNDIRLVLFNPRVPAMSATRSLDTAVATLTGFKPSASKS